ncbi:MAG TPA: hypothetical protein VJN02_03905 [Gammaproteobacteria bacterium]|nr:hypothetical protein [Gammaproteobacteria bacterium]
MKKLILGFVLLAAVYGSIAEARYTHSYFRQDGTYVNGYWGN